MKVSSQDVRRRSVTKLTTLKLKGEMAKHLIDIAILSNAGSALDDVITYLELHLLSDEEATDND